MRHDVCDGTEVGAVVEGRYWEMEPVRTYKFEFLLVGRLETRVLQGRVYRTYTNFSLDYFASLLADDL